MVHRKCAGFKRDEVYIGTAEERAALKAQASKDGADPTKKSDALDEDGEYNVRPGHMYPGVPTLPPDFAHHVYSLDEIEELEQELTEHKHDVEKRLADLQEQKRKLMNASKPVPATVSDDIEMSA
jgi:hypothetical protein